MSLVFLSLSIAGLWINLVGAGLASRRLVTDYAVARFSGLLGFCLVAFFLEHLAGWGPHPPLLPFTSALSLWLIWRHRSVLKEHWKWEVLFGAGFLYSLVWRYTFPNIDATGEKMPNLEMIEGYMRGTRLPAPDLWMPPFRANCYYSFQHYGAALMGRMLDIGPGVTYHLAYCTLAGFIALLAGSCVARLCPWRPGRWISVLSLMLGGSGAVVVSHVVLDNPAMIQSVRFLGGSVVHESVNPLGMRLARAMDKPGYEPRDLPMEPLSYVLVNGDYHPPLAGYVLLAFATTLIAANVCGAAGRPRAVNHALLAATVPVALISNAWVFPLQCLLVLGWFLYRALCGERGLLKPLLAGAGAAAFLEYPYLIEFSQQAIGDNASIGITAAADRTPLLGWLATFWPVAGILLLGLLVRERRSFTLFLFLLWVGLLVGTEVFYNHDVYGGVWIRFNTTMKWWPWVYAGILLTQGAVNLGSRSRLCRYGTVVLLVPTLLFAGDIGRQFARTPKEFAGQLSGSGWIEKDIVVQGLIADLRSRPDGIVIESGLVMANSEAPAVALFAGKPSLLGWPWHETTWRGPFLEIRAREDQIDAFYANTQEDPVDWLLRYDVRYVLWMQKDNVDHNSRFAKIRDKIKSHYFWHHVYGDNVTVAIGYWERIDPRPGT